MVFYLLCIIRRFLGIESVNEKKSNRCIAKLADVVLCVMAQVGDVILAIERRPSYHGQCQYVANRLQRSFLMALLDNIRASAVL